MIKLHATITKKVPIPNLDYSSRSCLAGMEIEISDGATGKQIQQRIRDAYHHNRCPRSARHADRVAPFAPDPGLRPSLA